MRQPSFALAAARRAAERRQRVARGQSEAAAPGCGDKDVTQAPEGRQPILCLRPEEATGSIDRSVGTARREIDLLNAYRTRLIADMVTGKLDVRDAAARLPEEAEEAEPLDEAEAMGEDDAEGEGANLGDLSEEAMA